MSCRWVIWLLLTLTACTGKAVPAPAPSPAEAKQPAFSTRTSGGGGPDFDYEISYPQFIPDDAATRAMNKVLTEAVDAAVGDFKTGVGEFGADVEGKSGLTGTFETPLVTAGFASVRLTFSQYFAGAAHPGAAIVTFNFDRTTGAQLALADLFKVGTPHLELLSQRCREVLKEKFAGDGLDESMTDWINKGTAPTAEHFAAWALGKRGLEITFQEYQVAPYAAGPQRCDIEPGSLTDVLAPGGPLT